jgi:RNA polymerase sigma-70 factor, ECF subfamily
MGISSSFDDAARENERSPAALGVLDRKFMPESSLTFFAPVRFLRVEGGSLTPDSELPPFAEVVREQWIVVFRFLAHLTGNDHDAEELTQETFLRAWQGWAKANAEPGTKPRAWLLRIARNAFVDFYRRRQSLPLRALVDDRLPFENDPGRRMEIGEQAAAIRSALQEIPQTARLVFLLRVEGELSFAEIAEELGTSEEAARWHMHQARTKLLARMSPKE